jgi:hypothetical protein
MIGPHFFNLHGVRVWAGMLKDYWSIVIASMGGFTLIPAFLWPCTALYYHLTPAALRGHYWRPFLLDDDR